MRILVIADTESKNYWDYYSPGKLDDIDLIISCGDLNPHYLQFLVTFAHCPLLYVRGNHDGRYEKDPPDGCICIEDSIFVYEGVRILGFGGSLRYNKGPLQYEQDDMKKRVKKLWLSLKLHKGFDILVTHAPAYRIGDGQDRCHTGFEAFVELMKKYRPKYFLHGHVHTNYGRKFKRLNAYEDTLIINGYETYIFDYESEYEEQFKQTLEVAVKQREECDAKEEVKEEYLTQKIK